MGGKVWFGTANRMKWIKAPLPGVDRSIEKWRSTGQFLNGGAWVRKSAVGARKASMIWPTMTSDEIAELEAFFDGVYGDEYLYYSDPFARNSLTAWLATPSLACDGGPKFYGSSLPTKVATPTNSYDYPTNGATYAVTATAGRKWRFPVPPNETMHIGVHGSKTGSANVLVDTPSVPATALTLLPVTTDQLTNYSYTAPSSGGWVFLFAQGSGTLTLYGMHAEIGDDPPIGNFRTGQGYTGLELASDPQITGYSAAISGGREAISADLKETEAWL